MRKKILLVDDVRLFLKLEETFFRRTGCEILTAERGDEAVKTARTDQPDLILLDYIMPDMMGDEVIRRLKSDEKTRGIPIMIVSTSADARDIEKCFAAGADDYVTKPINPQEVLAKAANILNIPHRVHYRIAVTLNVGGEAGGRSFTGFSRNISRGGILVECQQSLSPEAVVSLDLPLVSEDEPIRLSGKIVRMDHDPARQSYLLGIQFVQLSSDQEETVAHFIKTRQPSSVVV